MSWFKKDKRTPAQKEIDRIYEDMKKKEDAYMVRQRKVTRCNTMLKECDRIFDDTIAKDISTAIKMEENGFVAQTQRDKIKQAAMGKIVAKRALLELESVETEQQLNSAINLLGTAVRQITRMSDLSIEAILPRNRNAIEGMLPDAENVDNEIFAILEATDAPIPAEIAGRVNESFVNDLISGMDFEECLKVTAHPLISHSDMKSEPDSKKYDSILKEKASKK